MIQVGAEEEEREREELGGEECRKSVCGKGNSRTLETVYLGEELQEPLWDVSGVGEELERGNEYEVRCRRNHISGISSPGPRCILRREAET